MKIRENSNKVYNVLKKLYADVVDYVKENQGEKGFILTTGADSIYVYAILFEAYMEEIQELELKAIKVEANTLILLCDDSKIDYDEEAVADAEENDWTVFSLFGDEFVNASTLLSICECIEEYK